MSSSSRERRPARRRPAYPSSMAAQSISTHQGCSRARAARGATHAGGRRDRRRGQCRRGRTTGRCCAARGRTTPARRAGGVARMKSMPKSAVWIRRWRASKAANASGSRATPRVRATTPENGGFRRCPASRASRAPRRVEEHVRAGRLDRLSEHSRQERRACAPRAAGCRRRRRVASRPQRRPWPWKCAPDRASLASASAASAAADQRSKRRVWPMVWYRRT